MPETKPNLCSRCTFQVTLTPAFGGLITMRRALMELALCHFWAAYDSKSPNPWRRHALRIGDHLWARYGVVKMDIILSRNSPPLEYILDFGIAQVAESWLELVLPSSAKSSRCRVLARGYEKSPTWSEVAWMCEYLGTRT